MPEETPQEPQVQAPKDTPRERPSTTDPAWHLLFDRLDAQDDNIKLIGQNTVVIAAEQNRLREHVNDEQDKFSRLLETTVRKGKVLEDLFDNIRHNRTAQVALVALFIAMAPVIADHWHLLYERFNGVF